MVYRCAFYSANSMCSVTKMFHLTLRMKSGGVPGRTVGLRTPSWCEWINVSSRSKTRIFRLTVSEHEYKHKLTGQSTYIKRLHTNTTLSQRKVTLRLGMLNLTGSFCVVIIITNKTWGEEKIYSLSRFLEMGDNGKMSYRTVWYWII